VDITILVNHASVPSVKPLAVETLQVASPKPILVVPQRREAARRERDTEDDISHRTSGNLLAIVVDDSHVEPRHRFSCRASLDWQWLDEGFRPQIFPRGWQPRKSGHRRPRLRRPPVVDARRAIRAVLLQKPLVHVDDGGLAALAGEEQRAEGAEAAAARHRLEEGVVGVLDADGAQRGRRREHGVDAVLLDHPPEGARVGRADRLAFEEHRCRARQQRRVHDVRVPHYPPDVRRREYHVAWPPDPEDIRDGEVQADGVASRFAQHSFGKPGRAWIHSQYQSCQWREYRRNLPLV